MFDAVYGWFLTLQFPLNDYLGSVRVCQSYMITLNKISSCRCFTFKNNQLVKYGVAFAVKLVQET